MIEVVVAEDADDRTEDLLLGGPVRVVGQVEHGGLEVVAPVKPGRSTAAARHRAAALFGEADELFAAGALRGGDDRSHQLGWIGRAADRDVAVGGADRGDHFVLAVVRDEHPGGGHAGLARGHGHDGHGTAGDPVDRVVEVDLGRLAAEFEGDPLHRRGGLGEDPPTNRGRAGERHHVDRRIGGEELCALGAVLHDHAEHAGRQARRLRRRERRRATTAA